MSEAQEQGADAPIIEAADTPDVAADATQDAPQSTPDAQIEAAARSSGWSDKDKWKGDPNDWLPAPQFILKAVGEVLPTMRKSLKDARDEIGTMKTTLAKTVATAYDRALADLKTDQIAALEAGNLDAADEITDRIAEHKAAGKPAEADPFQSTFDAWKTENAWYESDPDLKAFAYGIAQDLAGKGMTPAEQLPEVTKRVKAAFPQKFENPRRREPAAAEGSTNARRTGGKTFSDLPNEARQMCVEFERDIKGFDRNKYVKDYFADAK